MAGFLRALGWAEAPSSEPVHRVFQLSNGLVVALYGAHNYERDYGPGSDGFRGFTLGISHRRPDLELDDRRPPMG